MFSIFTIPVLPVIIWTSNLKLFWLFTFQNIFLYLSLEIFRKKFFFIWTEICERISNELPMDFFSANCSLLSYCWSPLRCLWKKTLDPLASHWKSLGNHLWCHQLHFYKRIASRIFLLGEFLNVVLHKMALPKIKVLVNSEGFGMFGMVLYAIYAKPVIWY